MTVTPFLRGIATVHRHSDDRIAMWQTSRVGAYRVQHVNAVVLDVSEDPDWWHKVEQFTAGTAVLLTPGTRCIVDIDGAPLSISDVAELVDETSERAASITDAVARYRVEKRAYGLVEPTFPRSPGRETFALEEKTPEAEARAIADYLAAAWEMWLRVDEERRRRTVQPKTGTTPWIMPVELNSPDVADFPARFQERAERATLRDRRLRQTEQR